MKNLVYKFLIEKVRPIELSNLLKRLLLIRRRPVSINGSHYYLDPVSNFGYRLLTDRYYEPDTTDLILSLLEEGDSFLDLGANEGYFSILASKRVGTRGRVISVEPQARLWVVLVRNISLNHCLNVKLIPFAVSDKSEELELVLTPSINTGSSGVVGSARKQFWSRQKASAITLDQLIGEEKIKLMKVDIEGFELMALKGATETLKAGRLENILVELHPAQLRALGQSPDDVDRFLVNFGYKNLNGIYSRRT